MPTEGFFHRWSRLKTEPEAAAPSPTATAAATTAVAPATGLTQAQPGGPLVQPVQGVPQGGTLQRGEHSGEAAAARLPTLDDVAQLDAGSDYSAFVARGVDQSVRRSALKKLFSDPHFNIGDGLDLYMGDYNRPDPIPPAMMSALRHTESFFAQAYPEKETEKQGGERPAQLASQAAPPDPPVDAAPDFTGHPGEDDLHVIPEPRMANTTGADGAIEENA